MNLYRSLRATLATYILCLWKDKPIRDILTGSQLNFVDRAQKTILLHSYLSLLSDPSQPIIQQKRPRECLEVLCTALMLRCRVSVLSLDRDDVLHCEDVGDTTSPIRVFVALNRSKFFGFNKIRTQTSNHISQSSTSPHSSHTATQLVHRNPSFQTPTPTLSPLNASSTSSANLAEDCPGWGVKPVENSDEHLRSTWPETEAVMRSLSLYNGIWTDAQTLQYINWTHRVSTKHFKYFVTQLTQSYLQVALSSKEGQRTLPHKNTRGTQAICAVCNQYCLRAQFTKTQWDKQKQRDGNVPRTCNNCLSNANVEDLLNVDMISNADGDPEVRRTPRPSHFRTETTLDALLDPTRDRDSGQTQAARNQERAYWLKARSNRCEKQNQKRKRGDDEE